MIDQKQEEHYKLQAKSCYFIASCKWKGQCLNQTEEPEAKHETVRALTALAQSRVEFTGKSNPDLENI